MKQLFTILFVCSFLLTYNSRAQEQKTYSKPLTAGEVTISTIRNTMVNGNPTVIYTLNVPVTASYFIQAFGSFSGTAKTFFSKNKPGSFARANEFSLPVSKTGWQVIPCAAAPGKTILLEAGVQEISFFTTGNAFPLIDMLSISKTGNDARFNNHTAGFLAKLDVLKQETMPQPATSKADESMNKILANPLATYEHQVDEAFSYSTYSLYYFTAGTTITFETKNSTKDPVLHLFDAANPDANSWYNDDDGPGFESLLSVTIPVSGYYGLLARPYYDNQAGTTDIYKDNAVFFSATPIGGRRFDISMANTGNRNFFTCKLTGSVPDTRLFTLTAPGGAVRGYNDDYSPAGGDWSWGRASRIKKNFLSNTTTTFVCAYGTANNGSCDVYMGNPNSSAYTDWAFPNYKQNDCIQAAPSSGTYNCISWSGGVTTWWEWPLDNGSSYYVANNPLQSFDNFYKNTPKRYSFAWNYTRTGANVNNAVVDLWKIPNGGNYTHGSVTKPGNSNPHGYDWESKPGGLERSFHPRNALNGPGYGAVSNYYIHDGTYAPAQLVILPGFKISEGMATDADAVKAGLDVYDEAKLSDAASMKLQDMVRKTDGSITGAFEELYKNWKATWAQNMAFSDPAAYTQNDAYKQLYAFAVRNTDAVLPVIFKLFTSSNEEILACKLLWALTESKYSKLMNDVKSDNLAKPNDAQGRYIIRSMYGNYIHYIEKILGGLTETPKAAAANISVNVSPNPVRNRFAVSFTLNTTAKVSITAASAQTGRKQVVQDETTLQPGAHRFTADATRFAGGTGDFISVQVTVNGVTTTTKVMIGQ